MKLDERLSEVPSIWMNNRVHFFKYMSAATAKIVLGSGTLRWSTPGTLNDPYDVQFDLPVDIDRSLLLRKSLDKLWKAAKGKVATRPDNLMGHLIRSVDALSPHQSRTDFEKDYSSAILEGFEGMMRVLPEVNAEVRASLLCSKLLCLTTDPSNTPMWAHYADQNRGAVFRFRSIPFLDSAFGMARPVRYVDDLPTLMDEDFLSDMLVGLASFDAETVHERTNRRVFTKGQAWSYEKEWRIHSGDGRNKDAPHEDLPFHDLELDGVILGTRMPEADCSELINLSRNYSNVELLEAAISSSSFSHTISPLCSHP